MRCIAATLLVLATLLSACSAASTPLAPTIQPANGSAPAQAPASPAAAGAQATDVVITFGAQEYERQMYQPLIDAFNAEHPGLRVQFVSLDDIFQATAGQSQVFDPNAMMRRIVSAADTVVNWSVSPDQVARGYVSDLKPLMDADASFDRADYWAGALSVGEVAGGIYMLPRTMRVRLLSYNKDLFAARGVAEPKPDWSWADMLEVAGQVAHKNGTTVDTYGLLDWSTESTVLFGELAQRNVDLWNTPSDQIALDTPEIAAAIERIKALVDSGAIYYQQRDPSTPVSSDQFQSLITEQHAAIWSQELTNMGPQGATLPFATGIVLFPELPPPFSYGGADGYLMSAGTQHPTEAWRWLSWLSRQETKQPFAGPDTLSSVPARKSVADTSGYWSTLDTPVAEAIRASLERPQAPQPVGASDGRFYEPLNTALQAVLGGKQDAQHALEEAQQSLEHVLAQASPSAASAVAETGPIVVATPVVEQAPADATAITFGAAGGDPSIVRRIARDFNTQNTGVWVEVKDLQSGPSPTTISELSAQVDCFTWWGAPQTEELTATLDLKPLIDADAAFPLDEYPPALLAPFTRGEGLYGLPQTVSIRVLMYNPQAFERAGLEPPTIEWTIDDFVNAAQQLTSGQGDDKRFGYISLGGQASDVMFFVQHAGATIIAGSGDTAQPNFVDPKVIQAVRTYLDMLKHASPYTKLSGYTRTGANDDSYNLIAQGRAGMWFDYGGSFMMSGPDQAVKPAMAPLPLGGQPLAPDDLSVRGLHISAGTEHPDACWTWLKYISSQVGSFDGSFPARASLLEDPALTAQLPAGAAEVYAAYSAVWKQAPAASDGAEPFYQSKIDFFWLFRAVDRAMQGEELERELQDAQVVTEQYLACVAGDAEAYTCAKQVDPDYDGWQSAPEPSS